MSEMHFDRNSRWDPLTPEDLEWTKELEKKYNIRLLFNDKKLTYYCWKTVKILASNSKTFFGKVTDYVHPEDNEPREQSIIVDAVDGGTIEFYEHDIKNIEVMPETFKVKYISYKKSVFFKRGEVYEAFLPKDNPSGDFYAFHLPDMDEPGDYALPASRFEVIEECLK